MKKKINLIIALLFVLVFVNFVSAINLDVSAEPNIINFIKGIEKPKNIELTIRNLGESDNFEIYSLEGIELLPVEPIYIGSGETKKVNITMKIKEPLRSMSGYFSIEYKIRNSKNEVKIEKLTLNLVELKDAVTISPESIDPDSKNVKVLIKNNLNYYFKSIDLEIKSAFFEYLGRISLKPKEERELTIKLNKDKLKTLEAGSYLVGSEIKVEDEKIYVESLIKYLEQEGIENIKNQEGFFIKRQEITKKNIGNTVKTIKIMVEKNLLSYLFTTFNEDPEITFNGLMVQYSWKKDLIPNQDFKVIVKTNYLWPIIIIIFCVLFFIYVKRTIEKDLIIQKKVSFVKTKGGEFALKVSLHARAKKDIEKIQIIDRLPNLVKLYNKFGAISPDKINPEKRTLEWKVETLSRGEKRVFSYIIYSKIGVFGKFELPAAKAIYERRNKIKRVESNKSFFINEEKSTE